MARRRFLLLTIGLVILATAPLRADFFSAADDFSIASNPNGPWSYGFRTDVVSTGFTAYTLSQHDYPLDATVGQWYKGWFSNDTGTIVPYVAQNVDATPNGFATVPFILSGQLVMHPGDDASVVRWTAPDAGTVSLLSVFTRLDVMGGFNSQVAVVHNGTALFNETVANYFGTDAFNSTFDVGAGDSIDFVVGKGPDGTFTSDSTAFSGVIDFTAVPEPATLVSMLLALGTAGIIVRARRRKKAA